MTETAPSLDFAAATEDDVPVLATLLGELFVMERDFVPDRDKQERGLRHLLAHPELGRVFVVKMDGHIIGMASLLFTVSTAEGGPAAILEDVFIDAGHRGTGIGSGLIEQVLRWAQSHGYLRVTLLADRNNAPALRFYERLGFTLSNMLVYRRRLKPGDPVNMTREKGIVRS